MPTLRAKTQRVYHRLTDEQPFEVFGAAFALLVGVPLILKGAQPDSIQDVLPDILVRLWAINLTFGAALTLFGLGKPSQMAEKFGLSLLSSACLVYAIILTYVAWPQGAVAAAIILAFSCAAWARRSSLSRVTTIREDAP